MDIQLPDALQKSLAGAADRGHPRREINDHPASAQQSNQRAKLLHKSAKSAPVQSPPTRRCQIATRFEHVAATRQHTNHSTTRNKFNQRPNSSQTFQWLSLIQVGVVAKVTESPIVPLVSLPINSEERCSSASTFCDYRHIYRL